MEIVIADEADLSIWSIRGRLDTVSAPRLEERLGKWSGKPGSKLIFDLAEMEYVSSAGLRVFLAAAKRMKAIDGKLGLACLRPSVREVFVISGFLSILPSFDTLDAAKEALR